ITQFVSFTDAFEIAAALDKTKSVDVEFNFEKRYTLWSGLAAGFILQLSYFGTDQSQVGRYLGGKSSEESKKGLVFNAILKVPMQFFILFLGVTVYLFYIFYQPPVHFKYQSLEMVRQSSQAPALMALESQFEVVQEERREAAVQFVGSVGEEKEVWRNRLQKSNSNSEQIRQEVNGLIKKVNPDEETTDADFVFLSFIMKYLPNGLIGLLIAVVLSAAMSSTSSALNALASTSAIDFYKRLINRDGTERQYLLFSKAMTVVWGLVAISFALFIENSENLIQAVNIIGSLFYGSILGIFLVAFLLPKVRGNAVFIAGVTAELVVLACHFLTVAGYFKLGYLWYNAIGLGITFVFSWVLSFFDSATTLRRITKDS
ncbi:MAG: sodium:solute symporter, partial [Bacteroidota bacterium]